MAAMRTPPPKLTIAQVSSENDIANLDPENPTSYVGRRQKRPRKDNQGKSEEPSLREELLTMLSDWKKDQDITLNKLCLDIAELKSQNSSIQTTTEELERSIKFMSSQYDEIRSKFQDMERERKEHLKHITTLEHKIDEMQKKLKSTVIEFRNVPQQAKQETQQDRYELVQKICKSFDTHVQPSDVKDIYRITAKSGVTSVITDLSSVLIKDKILNGVKVYNQTNPNNKLSSSTIGLQGPSKPIYITESLTNKDRKLFAMARDAAKTLQYKYCWTQRGNIYMRKTDGSVRLVIRNEEDLSMLKNN